MLNFFNRSPWFRLFQSILSKCFMSVLKLSYLIFLEVNFWHFSMIIRQLLIIIIISWLFFFFKFIYWFFIFWFLWIILWHIIIFIINLSSINYFLGFFLDSLYWILIYNYRSCFGILFLLLLLLLLLIRYIVELAKVLHLLWR